MGATLNAEGVDTPAEYYFKRATRGDSCSSGAVPRSANNTDEVNLFSGIIRCADCGASMAFVRRTRKSGNDKVIYRCSRYNNNGKDVCSTHTIDAEVLECVVLKDIQHHAKMAIKDESVLLDRLFSFSGKEAGSKKPHRKRPCTTPISRIRFIEDASKRLFEEKIMGNVPDGMFKKMFADYEAELTMLGRTGRRTAPHHTV